MIGKEDIIQILLAIIVLLLFALIVFLTQGGQIAFDQGNVSVKP